MVDRREGHRNEVRLSGSIRPRDIMLVASGFAARCSAVFAAVWLVGALAVAQAAQQDGAGRQPAVDGGFDSTGIGLPTLRGERRNT